MSKRSYMLACEGRRSGPRLSKAVKPLHDIRTTDPLQFSSKTNMIVEHEIELVDARILQARSAPEKEDLTSLKGALQIREQMTVSMVLYREVDNGCVLEASLHTCNALRFP